MAIERIDNWELVLAGSELDGNNRYKIEDSHIRCALIREIGTDSSTMVDFGLRDHPYMDIDTFIAPYYKGSNNLNVMRFSGKKGLKWAFTGFELPLPLDLELEINGLASAERVYMKGTLFKNVMSADDPINQYLMARLIEHNYKQLRPLYWKDVTIDAAFDTADEEYVLDTSGAVADLVPWKPQDPKYTMSPSQNISYVIKNTIQVMWGDETLLPKDVEFRLKHNRIDVGAMPRLDHMFLPPADGITRYMEETLSVGGIDDCDSDATWGGDTANALVSAQNTILKEGDNAIKVTCDGTGWLNDAIIYTDLAAAFDPTGFTEIGFWIGATVALDAGDLTLVLSSADNAAKAFVEAKLPKIAATAASADMSYIRVLIPAYPGDIKSVGFKNTSGGSLINNNIYIDDIRALPLRVTGNPMQDLVKVLDAVTPFAAIPYAANYATGEIELTYSTIPTSVLVGYYAFRSGGGRDVFSLREIKADYHKVTYPHKQSYVFVNKSGANPSGTATMDLYTLAEYYQTIPGGQEISPSVLAAARELLV